MAAGLSPAGEIGRLPDFVIIGAMKSGTTSLFRWLGEQTECALPSVKEPHFFSRDDCWSKGIGWYTRHFDTVPPNKLTGEASVSYTSPGQCGVAAARMADTVPDARLIYVVRDPVERMRSHYRHQVQRGRERRPIADALAEPGNDYVGQSMYFSCLSPYVGAFERSQICVVRLEDLGNPGGTGWPAVLRHLGLAERPLPSSMHNVTAAKPQYSKAMLALWESGRLPAAAHAPKALRKVAKRILTRSAPKSLAALQESEGSVPPDAVAEVVEDAARLSAWLELDAPLWGDEQP